MSASPNSLRVKTIDHITLVVQDLDRSAWFYRDVLGMQPTERPQFSFPGLWFQAGATQIHMNVAGPEAGRAGLPPLGATMPTRGFHFAFEVEDCDQAAKQLAAFGLEVVAGPRPRPDGARQAYVYDPDGHLVEIYSRAPCSA